MEKYFKMIYGVMLAIVVMGVIIARDQKKKMDALRTFRDRSGKHFKIIECSKNWLLQSLWIPGLSLVLMAYVWLVPSSVGGPEEVPNYIITAALMAVVTLGYLVSEKTFQNLYISRDSFYHSGQTYRFTSVKSIESDKKNYKLHMMNGDTLHVSREKAMAIQDQIDRRQRKVK